MATSEILLTACVKGCERVYLGFPGHRMIYKDWVQESNEEQMHVVWK